MSKKIVDDLRIFNSLVADLLKEEKEKGISTRIEADKLLDQLDISLSENAIDDEGFIKHFILPSKKESIKLKKILRQGRGGAEFEKYVEKYSPQTKALFRQTAEGSRVGFIFSGSTGDILGPKKNDQGFHFFEILKKY